MARLGAREYVFHGMWRIVIQDSRSLQYLCAGGSWSYDVPAARTFSRVVDAVDHCARVGLKDVYIVAGRLGADGRFDSATKSIVRLPRIVTMSSSPDASGSSKISR